MTSFFTKISATWRFLFDMYIVQPKAKDGKKFRIFYSVLIMLSVITLLQINYILYPSPELSEISKVEGVLFKVEDNTGGRHSSITITVLKDNKEKVSVSFSSGKEEVVFYKKNVGSHIQVWYRWNLLQYSSRQVVLNGEMIHPYSKDRQLKMHEFSSIFLYIILPFWFYFLLKPWVVLLVRKLK